MCAIVGCEELGIYDLCSERIQPRRLGEGWVCADCLHLWETSPEYAEMLAEKFRTKGLTQKVAWMDRMNDLNTAGFQLREDAAKAKAS